MQNDLNNASSRRDFIRSALAAGTGALAAGAAATLATGGRAALAADAPSVAPPSFFDIHTHYGRTFNSGEELTLSGLLNWMDKSNVAQAVVLPLVSPEASTFLLTPDRVLAETRPHRDRLIPFCNFDPRTTYTQGRRGLVGVLKRYIDAGARGLGEHKPGVRIDDKRSMDIYAACAEVELPILFHLDNERNMDLPGLPGLERVLKAFPTVNFIGHGPGWWASISGDVKQPDMNGYPEGKVAPGGAIDRLMSKYKNLWGDLSAGSGAGALQRDLDFGKQFLIRRADRLMFGSDYLAPRQDVPQLTLLRLMKLPHDVERKIFRENARGLLKLTS